MPGGDQTFDGSVLEADREYYLHARMHDPDEGHLDGRMQTESDRQLVTNIAGETWSIVNDILSDPDPD